LELGPARALELGPARALELGPAARVAALLSEAYDLLARVRTPQNPTAGDYLGLVMLGVVSTIAGYATSRGLLLLFGNADTAPIGMVLAGLGRVLGALSPVLGLAGIKWYLDRRVVRVGIGPVVVVIASGILTAIVAILLRPLTNV
jgi:hypothetical protein